jgi:hypothetical protein
MKQAKVTLAFHLHLRKVSLMSVTPKGDKTNIMHKIGIITNM